MSRKVSRSAGLICGLLTIAAALSLAVRIANGTYDAATTPPESVAAGALVVGILAAVEIWAALRRSDALRAAVMWAIAIQLMLSGIGYGIAIDPISTWFVAAGIVGIAGAVAATAETTHKRRLLGLIPLATLVTYAALWVVSDIVARRF